jgi:hypothetical protein
MKRYGLTTSLKDDAAVIAQCKAYLRQLSPDV